MEAEALTTQDLTTRELDEKSEDLGSVKGPLTPASVALSLIEPSLDATPLPTEAPPGPAPAPTPILAPRCSRSRSPASNVDQSGTTLKTNVASVDIVHAHRKSRKSIFICASRATAFIFSLIASCALNSITRL